MRTLDLAAVRARLAEHPWPTVGIAAAAGAGLGFLLGARAPKKASLSTKLGELVLAALGALAFRIARDVAAKKLGAIALEWWDEAQRRTEEPTAPMPRPLH